jgi:hypothetical protein
MTLILPMIGSGYIATGSDTVAATYVDSHVTAGGTSTKSISLPAGRLIILAGMVRGGNAAVSVGGNSATVTATEYTNDDSRLAVFQYDNPTAATLSVVLEPGGGNLNSVFHVYAMATTVTATVVLNTLPQTTAAVEGLIFMSQTINSAASIPAATNALTVDFNADIRSNEFNYTAHRNGATTISGSVAAKFLTVLLEP